MNNKRLKRFGLALLGLLTLAYLTLYVCDKTLYRAVIREDSVTEWATALLLFASAYISGMLGFRVRKKHGYWHWFFVVFACFSLLAGLEEISWGQRLLNIRSGEFFRKYNDQQETNLHNTLQGVSGIKTKHIALVVMFVYGVVLPWLLQKNRQLQLRMHRWRMIIPPAALIPCFLAATLLMLDFQTGHEEEIGELYFSITFVLLMVWQQNLFKAGHFKPEQIGLR